MWDFATGSEPNPRATILSTVHFGDLQPMQMPAMTVASKMPPSLTPVARLLGAADTSCQRPRGAWLCSIPLTNTRCTRREGCTITTRGKVSADKANGRKNVTIVIPSCRPRTWKTCGLRVTGRDVPTESEFVGSDRMATRPSQFTVPPAPSTT